MVKGPIRKLEIMGVIRVAIMKRLKKWALILVEVILVVMEDIEEVEAMMAVTEIMPVEVQEVEAAEEMVKVEALVVEKGILEER